MDVRSRSSFLLGAATNWLAFAATLAVGFFLTPYLIQSLGKPRYDVWCVVESVLAYFTLLDLGLAACLVRAVARHSTTADTPALNRTSSACLAIFLAAAVVAVVAGAPILLALSPGLEAKSGAGDTLPFMLLMLVNLAATLPLSVFPSILDGLERFAVKSAVRVAFLALKTTGIVLAMNAGGGLLPLALVSCASNLVEHGVMALLCFRFLPELRFSRRSVDRAALKEVRGASADAFLAMLAGRVSVQTGAIVVGLFLPPGSVTFFVTAARLVEYAKTLLRTITTTLTPGVSAMEARGNHAGIRRLFLTVTRGVLYIVLPVNLGLWFFGGPFLARWVGPEFVAGSYPTTAILALTLTIGVAQSVASRILYGLGRLRLFARLAMGEAALNVVLTLALIRPLGVEGVAWAVAVPNVLFCACVISYTTRAMGASGVEYGKAWLRPLLASVTPAVIWFLVGTPEPTWLAIAVAIGAGLVPYAAVVGLLELPRLLAVGERRQLLDRDAADQKNLVAVRRPAQQLDL
jgi:O-antigen/teichoic acid export membrane protein